MDNTIIYNDAKHIAAVCDLKELSGKQILITGASGLFGVYMLFTLKETVAKGAGPAQVYAVIHGNLPRKLQVSKKNYGRGDRAECRKVKKRIFCRNYC